MAPRVVPILALVACLGLLGCGAHGVDTPADAGDAGRHDTATDSGADDAGPDGGQDGGQDAGPATARQFLSETSGGARLLSSNYRLELFVAPAPPAGSTASSAYRLRLGPGALRNAR